MNMFGVPKYTVNRCRDQPRRPSTMVWPTLSPSALGCGTFHRSCTVTRARPPSRTVTTSLVCIWRGIRSIIDVPSILKSTSTLFARRWPSGIFAFSRYWALVSLQIFSQKDYLRHCSRTSVPVSTSALRAETVGGGGVLNSAVHQRLVPDLELSSRSWGLLQAHDAVSVRFAPATSRHGARDSTAHASESVALGTAPLGNFDPV
jgi:hypothetical protein